MPPPDTSEDGPQSATRHVKDRRPAMSTQAARSLALLEQRTSALERRHHSLPQTAPSPRHNAALDLDAALKNFGQRYNELDERQEDLDALLAKINDRLKPYEDYQQQALTAVKQLQQLESRLQSASPSKPDAGVSKLVIEHESSIRDFSGRLSQLEDQHELAKAQPLSTRDLARALVQRLKRGDILDDITTLELHRAIDSQPGTTVPPVPPPVALRQQDTPVTEDSEPRASAVQASIEERQQSPTRKRRRTEHSPRAARTKQATSTGSEPTGTPQVESALSSFKSGALHDSQSPEDDAADFAMQNLVIPPEVRRTSRQPKPARQHPDMVHWREANKRVKGIRPSGSSSRKST